MKVALLLTALILVAAYLYSLTIDKREAALHLSHEIPYGPFTIKVSGRVSTGFNVNAGVVKYTDVAYGIFYQGQPVAFPGALQNNTGLPFLWAVYALPGAPDPTLVAGSQSIYLIYLKDGAPVVEPILQQGHDFASLQFLDSEAGQPGRFTEVFMKSEVNELDKSFLDFVLGQMGWSKEHILSEKTHEYTGQNLYLGSGAVKLDITYKEEEQTLLFSKHLYDETTPEYEALVKKIAEAFNAELRAGNHQEHFGRIISETKRIRGY